MQTEDMVLLQVVAVSENADTPSVIKTEYFTSSPKSPAALTAVEEDSDGAKANPVIVVLPKQSILHKSMVGIYPGRMYLSSQHY